MNTLVEISETLCKAKADVALSQCCPRCHGSLNVRFIKGPKASMDVYCARCDVRIHSDGIEPSPPWVSALGDEFVTREEIKKT